MLFHAKIDLYNDLICNILCFYDTMQIIRKSVTLMRKRRVYCCFCEPDGQRNLRYFCIIYIYTVKYRNVYIRYYCDNYCDSLTDSRHYSYICTCNPAAIAIDTGARVPHDGYGITWSQG